MTDEQIRETLAIKVMGWHEDCGTYWKDVSDGNDELVMGYNDWQPTQNIEQALMCAMEYVNSELGIYTEIDINISPNGIDVSISKYKEGVDDGTPPIFYCLKSGSVGEESKTICSALLEAVEK